MNILDELRRDHDRLRTTMTALETGPATPAELRAFAGDLLEHARLEDELLFGELDPALPPGHGPIAVMRAEHEEIEGGLAELTSAGPDGAERAGRLRRLLELARDHFDKEEQVLFAFAERLVEPGRLAALGAVLRDSRRGAAGPRLAPEVRIADLARERPATVRVFQKHGIDFCCGGKRSLAEACERHGIAYADLAGDLGAALGEPSSDDPENWSERTVVDLVGYILARYHAGLRDELARLEAMAARARERHGEAHAELVEVARLVTLLRREMVPHLELEEREIFPALMRGETEAVAASLRAAEAEHDGVGRLLAELRAATGGFVPPAEACNTWRGLYHGLAELERDTHLHVHVENNVLFHRLEATPGAA